MKLGICRPDLAGFPVPLLLVYRWRSVTLKIPTINLASYSHIPPVDNFLNRKKETARKTGWYQYQKGRDLTPQPSRFLVTSQGQHCVLWLSLDVREAEIIQRNEQNFDVSQLTADDWIL